MAEEKIKLQKKIISNKLSNSIYSKSFKDLAKSSIPPNDAQIKALYKTLFYTIPKKGKNSHESIIKESRDYLYPQINKKLDSQIDDLIEEIETKDKELTKLQTTPQANIEYPNGSIITAGSYDGQYQGMTSIYILQEGKKRELMNEELYKIARKALKIPGEDYSELFFLSIDELNQIPDGKQISQQSHFSETHIAINQGDLYQSFPYYILELYCEGREKKNIMSLSVADYYLDNDPENACSITYVKNKFDGDEEEYSIETETINTGQTKIIQFARNDNGIKGIPDEVTDSVYNSYYNYDNIQQIETRLWGKDSQYKGVLLAEGRLLITKGGGQFNSRTNKTLNSKLPFNEIYGSVRKIYSNGCKQVDGTYEDCFGNLNQDGNLAKELDMPHFKYYSRSTKFNKEQIEASLGIKYYTSLTPYPNNHLHLEDVSFSIYGQPILKLSGQYVVYLKSKNRFHYFYNLNTIDDSSALLKIEDEDIADYLFDTNNDVFKDQKTNYTNHKNSNSMDENPYHLGLIGLGDNSRFNWEAVKNSKIEYIGLTSDPIRGNKYTTNGYESSGGNYFNPLEGGSNYGISGEVRTILQNNSNVDYINSDAVDFCPFTKKQLEQFSFLSIPAGSNNNFPIGCTLQNCSDC
tara:strand:- start:178 stop:2082 length:1905 start_codon:yes stop_codon:yes gene_type:complete